MQIFRFACCQKATQLRQFPFLFQQTLPLQPLAALSAEIRQRVSYRHVAFKYLLYGVHCSAPVICRWAQHSHS